MRPFARVASAIFGSLPSALVVVIAVTSALDLQGERSIFNQWMPGVGDGLMKLRDPVIESGVTRWEWWLPLSPETTFLVCNIVSSGIAYAALGLWAAFSNQSPHPLLASTAAFALSVIHLVVSGHFRTQIEIWLLIQTCSLLLCVAAYAYLGRKIIRVLPIPPTGGRRTLGR